MAEDKAAFGVFPQIKVKHKKQDREAAKGMPLAAARGFVAGTLGLPSDVINLGGVLYSLVTGQPVGEVPYGSEHWKETLPLKDETPAGQAATELGSLFGGAGMGRPVKGALSMAKKVPRMAGEALNERLLSGQSLTPLINTPAPIMHVMKPKGGNWMTGSVEKELNTLKRNKTAAEALEEMGRVYPPDVMETMSPETRAQVERAIPHLQRESALNNWIDRNLTNFVKKEMATPEDPVRKLAEQGITHYPVAEDPGYWARHGATAREERGGEAMAQSPLAKQWENRTDAMIDRNMAQEHQDMMHLAPGMYSEQDAWIKKLDPSTQLYSAHSRHFSPLDLGFDHIIDVLREDLAAGRIRPEQLNKVSMEQAVRRTYEYDQELAKKMAEARAASREGLPVYKEYPEGFRWVELNKPGSFATESEAMGHSVRGYEPPVGHPDWIEGSGDRGSLGYGHGGWEGIKSGKAKVYSLVDPKGNPHVTVEAKVPEVTDAIRNLPATERHALSQSVKDQYFGGVMPGIREEDKFWSLLDQAYLDKYGNPSSSPVITQIKGKQNAAPKEEYLPFVQDFVRSSKMPVERDLHHTGMRDTGSVFNEAELQKLRDLGESELPQYMSGEDIQRYHNMIVPEGQRLKYDSRGNIIGLEGADGMKRGGKVHISNNPDTMQLELAGGGLTKLAKLARAPAKSKAEIEAIAERMAPQIRGEYVRESAKSAKTVAGKTQKQFEREKDLPVDIRATKEERTPQPVDIEKLKGEVMIGIPGDPTVAGKTLHGVGGINLESPSPQHGGPLYGLYHDDDHFWASGINAARKVQNLAKSASEQYDAPVVGKYIMMGPESLNFAQHFADANLQAIDLSKMNKRQIAEFDKLIREGYPYRDPQGKSRQRVFPGFPGIEDKDSAYLHMAMDSDLRKHFNSLMQMPTITENLNLPSGQDIRYAITEPGLRDVEPGVTGYSIGRMRPDIPATGLKLSEHPTYSHDIPGHFMGQSKYPTPYELTFPDIVKSIRENPRQAPHEFGTLQYSGPRQQIDQQLIDEIKMYEEMIKKLTGKAAGGAITGAALKAMERLKELKAEAALKADVWKAKQAADEGKYTQDIEAMTPEMMRAEIERMQNPVKKAAGGEITADDLIIEERPL